jgi:hypothetical protein
MTTRIDTTALEVLYALPAFRDATQALRDAVALIETGAVEVGLDHLTAAMNAFRQPEVERAVNAAKEVRGLIVFKRDFTRPGWPGNGSPQLVKNKLSEDAAKGVDLKLHTVTLQPPHQSPTVVIDAAYMVTRWDWGYAPGVNSDGKACGHERVTQLYVAALVAGLATEEARTAAIAAFNDDIPF